MGTKATEFNESKAFLSVRFDNEVNADGSADVEIVVKDDQGPRLYAHELVLANRSPVFRKMFEIGMLESETRVIRIDDASFPVIRAVIQFCYHAQIMFTDHLRAEDVLPVAHKYDIHLLKTICGKHLSQNLQPANLPRTLTLAKKFEVKELEREAIAYFKKYFDKVITGVVDVVF